MHSTSHKLKQFFYFLFLMNCISNFSCAHSHGRISNVGTSDQRGTYPAHWWAEVSPIGAPDWEILPQEAGPGEVILSKRNELGILSNFAATAFEINGLRYASVEGFWQMMKYPEGKKDERNKPQVNWAYSREQVGQLVAFEAKKAGSLAEENMKKLKIDWVTFEGQKMPYHSMIPGMHYELILKAMRAKLAQNPEVKKVLLSTGDLILRADHKQNPLSPPEWKYDKIWMQLRDEVRQNH